MATARDAQRERTFHALRAAAIRLVAERGFAAVTVDDVAAAAGTSRRTFFNHFPTKAAALFDADPHDADRLTRLLSDADGAEDPWGALAVVCVEFVAGHEDVIAVRRRLVSESPELDEYHRAAHRHVERALVEWARRRLPDDPLRAVLLGGSAAAVLTSAFDVWQPDDDPALLPRLVARGFALHAPA